MSEFELKEAINAIEPDDYSDWSINELQEFALFLGIDIAKESTNE